MTRSSIPMMNRASENISNDGDVNITTYSNGLINSIACDLFSGILPTDELRHLFDVAEDSTAIFVSALVIFIIGIVGNLITIFKVTKDVRLTRPVYHLLRCLAVADLFSLIVRYILNFTVLQYYFIFCHGLRLQFFYNILFFGTHHNSTYHIVMMAGYRLFLVIKPMKCQYMITSKKINVASLILWILSFVIGLMFALLIKFTYQEAEVNLAYSGYTLFVPCVLIVTFHFMKMRVSSNTDTLILPSRIRTLSNSVRRRLNLLMCIIIAFYAIPCVFDLAWFTLSLLKTPHTDLMTNVMDKWIDTIGKIASLLWLFSYAINPVIYFFYSKQIRRHFQCRKFY